MKNNKTKTILSSLALTAAVSMPQAASPSTLHIAEDDGFAALTISTETEWGFSGKEHTDFFAEFITAENSAINFNTPGMQAIAERSREKHRIQTQKTLADQAPDSGWEIKPVQNKDGTAMCVASFTSSLKHAVVRDNTGAAISEEEMSAQNIHANTFSITIPQEHAFVRLGFDAQDDITSSAAFERGILDSVILMDAAAFAQGDVTISAHSTNDHTVEYTIAEALPVSILTDCNTAAAAGEFDMEFAAIDDNLIAEFVVPAAEAQQEALKETFTAGGLCHAGFKPEEYGQMTRSSFYSPASTIGIDGNTIFVGDLLRAGDSQFTRSASLNGQVSQEPSVSGCTLNVEPVCSVTTEATAENGDSIISIRFCEVSQPAAGSQSRNAGYVTGSYNRTTTGSGYTRTSTTTTPGGNPINPINPTNPTNPTNPINPINPIDPICFIGCDPVNPIDPINPFNPVAPVPLPAAFWMLAAGIGALGAAKVQRRRKPEATSEGQSFDIA